MTVNLGRTRRHANKPGAIERARRALASRRKRCPDCDQPMLPAGQVKRPNEYDHASGCPRATQAPSVER